MTTQTIDTGTNPDTVAVQGPVSTPLPARSRRVVWVRRAVATAAAAIVALATFGVTWQIRTDDDTPAVVPRQATEADLRLAAEWARRTDNAASYADLRLAAEWARRLEILSAASAQETSGGN